MEFEPSPLLPLKATYFSLSARQKFLIIPTLISLLFSLLPSKTGAFFAPTTGENLVFVIGSHSLYLEKLNLQLSKLYGRKQMYQEIDKKLLLQQQVREYLARQNSPLADYVPTLLSLNNWKKIIALSNAESGFCRYYPVKKANCWGIGGSNLWYLGSNLKEGIISMNLFLNTYPNRSALKYSQMTFKQMNGLYKQPAASHWVINNQVIYDDLTAIENTL
jgi:hypothetical protein